MIIPFIIPLFKRESYKFFDGHRYGYANGYLALPNDHILSRFNYDEINEFLEVEYGFTFSNFAKDLPHDFYKDADLPTFFDTLKLYDHLNVRETREYILFREKTFNKIIKENFFIIGFDAFHIDACEYWPNESSVFETLYELIEKIKEIE